MQLNSLQGCQAYNLNFNDLSDFLEKKILDRQLQYIDNNLGYYEYPVSGNSLQFIFK